MSEATIDILLYHDIARNEMDAKKLSNPLFTTPLPRFRTHLQWLKRSSYKPIRLNQWLDARQKGENWKDKHVLLTFDGPHTGWFEYVLPLLVEMEMPATFFVIAGWVGEKHAFPESRHLRWEHISRIESLRDRKGKQLFDVGCHSMWHTELDRRAGESSQEYHRRFEEEVVHSTEVIRRHTGCLVRSYAPPSGDGDLNLLRGHFSAARIEALRWATTPGKRNGYRTDFFDLQISYCDNLNYASTQLEIVLSDPMKRFCKRLLRWFRQEIGPAIGLCRRKLLC